MTTKNNRHHGKAVEKRVAKDMKGRRAGIFGGEDVEHPLFSIEVKSRERCVAANFMEQAVRNCPAGKTPLVRIHIKSKLYNNDLIVMRLQDFEDYLGVLYK